MNKEKGILEKLFDAPFYVHFIVWTLIMGVMFVVLLTLLGGSINNMGVKVIISVSIMMGLMVSFMNWTAKKSVKVWDSLSEIKDRAKKATTLDELLDIRKEIVDFGSKCMHSEHYRERRAIVEFIDTRRRYEFKV